MSWTRTAAASVDVQRSRSSTSRVCGERNSRFLTPPSRYRDRPHPAPYPSHSSWRACPGHDGEKLRGGVIASQIIHTRLNIRAAHSFLSLPLVGSRRAKLALSYPSHLWGGWREAPGGGSSLPCANTSLAEAPPPDTSFAPLTRCHPPHKWEG